MKKARCANGGAIKQPMTMAEQLQGLRGKFADGGNIYPQERIRKPEYPQENLSFVGHLQKIGGLVARAVGEATGSQPAPTSNPVDPVEMIKRRNMANVNARDYAGGGMVKKCMAGGGVAGIDTPLSLQDEAGVRAALPTIGIGAIQNGGVATPLPAGGIGQSLGLIGAPKYESAGDYVPLWSDGSRRDNLTPEQAQQLKAEKAMSDARAAQMPQQAISAPAPLQTMAEKQIAAGINPNAAYRPGGPGDPHASTGMAATLAQRATVSAIDQPQAVPQTPANPFDTRSRRQMTRTPGMANGGVVDPVEELLKRTSKNYGLGQPTTSPAPQPAPAPQPQPQQAVASPQQPQPGVVDALRNRKQELERAMRYADGGMVRFSGKGGPREDRIPVKVAGEQINVSDGESAVILPAKTAANPQAIGMIGQIIQATNDGRAPDMGGVQKGGKYARGAYPYTDEEPPTAQQVYANVGPALQPTTPSTAPTAQQVYRDVSPSGLVAAITPPNNLKDHPIYGGVSMRGMIDAVTPSMRAPQQDAQVLNQTQRPANTAHGRAESSVTSAQPRTTSAHQRPQTVAEADRIRQILPGTMDVLRGTAEDMRNDVAAGNYAGAIGRLARGSVTLPVGVASDMKDMSGIEKALPMVGRAINTFVTGAPSATNQPGMATAAMNRQGTAAQRDDHGAPMEVADPRVSGMIGDTDNAAFNPQSGLMSFAQPGFDPTKVQMAPGTGFATATRTGQTIGGNLSPNQYIAADGTPNARWEQTQAYQDAIARNEADKLRLAEMQAVRQGMNPAQAIAATQGMSQAAANAPIERQLKQQQIGTGQYSLDQAKRLQTAADAVVNAKSAQERDAAIQTYHALTGKSEDKRYIPHTVKTYENGMPSGEQAVMFDTHTGQWINPGADQQKSFRTPEEADLARKSGKLKSGEVVIINGRQARVN